jgi:hypothetical protein
MLQRICKPLQTLLQPLEPTQLITLVLATITNWPIQALDQLINAEGFNLQPHHFQNEVWLIHLHHCLQIVKRVGVLPTQLKQWAAPSLSAAESQAIKDTVKAKYDEDTWRAVAQPLNDTLREKQRTALVDYVLALPDIQKLPYINDSNDLLEYFLIDVNMSACMITSRLKQAISSVQMFINPLFDEPGA